jgi:hypothetical protein
MIAVKYFVFKLSFYPLTLVVANIKELYSSLGTTKNYLAWRRAGVLVLNIYHQIFFSSCLRITLIALVQLFIFLIFLLCSYIGRNCFSNCCWHCAPCLHHNMVCQFQFYIGCGVFKIKIKVIKFRILPILRHNWLKLHYGI